MINQKGLCLYVYASKYTNPCLFVCFSQFPDALRPAFPRLKDRLDDPDTGKLMNGMEVHCMVWSFVKE